VACTCTCTNLDKPCLGKSGNRELPVQTYGPLCDIVVKEHSMYPNSQDFCSLFQSSGIIDVVYSFQCTPTSHDIYKLVPVPSLALALPRHMTSL